MTLARRILVLVSLCILLAARAVAAAPQPARITLVYSANLNGELEPCGCSESTDLGGLRRRATALSQLRRETRDAVLISTGGLLSSQYGSDRIKNHFILEGFRLLKYDAIGMQWGDLIHGAPFLLERGLPFSAANWRGSEFPRTTVIERAGQRLAYLQWLDPLASPHAGMPEAQQPIVSSTAPLAEDLLRAKQEGMTTIVGTTFDLPEAEARLPMALIDVLMLAPRSENPGMPQQRGRTLVLTPGKRGMRLARVDLELAADGRVVRWRDSVIPLGKDVDNAPELDAWYAAYNRELKADYAKRVERRQAEERGQTRYVGGATCAGCHPGAAAIWNSSDHAKAIRALEHVGKQFDPGCVSCHSVGFDQAGGYLDAQLTPHLADVQCEACHGAGRTHVEAAGLVAVDQPRPTDSACVTCHSREHSPSFDFSAYWSRIRHGGEAAERK